MEHSLQIIIVVALCTLLTRAFPFLLLGGRKEIPKVVQYLGKVLPSAIMVILVVYCVKDVNLLQGNHGIPEFLSIIVVMALHLWKKNTLLSIGIGTICYMILIQAVF